MMYVIYVVRHLFFWSDKLLKIMGRIFIIVWMLDGIEEVANWHLGSFHTGQNPATLDHHIDNRLMWRCVYRSS